LQSAFQGVPTVLDHINLPDGNGVDIAFITHFDNWVHGGEGHSGSAQEGGLFLPDDIWDLQFRLVSYTEILTDDSHVFPNDRMPAGISLPDQLVGCVSLTQGFGNPQVPPHELGHVILQTSNHVTGSSCTLGLDSNLMCAAGGGTAVTQDQCSVARNVIQGFHWADFFPNGP
jgi:hypothetical protein